MLYFYRTQILAKSERVAVPQDRHYEMISYATKHTIPDVYVETQISEIKDEEKDDGVEEVHGKAYGDLDSPYLKQFLSPRGYSVENQYGIWRAGANFMIGHCIVTVNS